MVQDSTRVPSIRILLTIHIVHAKENGEEMIPKKSKKVGTERMGNSRI